MVVFEPGDVVEIISVTEDDILRGIQVGCRAIVQPPSNEFCKDDTVITVLLKDLNWSYYIFPNQIRKIQSATLDTIFRAYLVEDDELLERVKQFVDSTLTIERSLTDGSK